MSDTGNTRAWESIRSALIIAGVQVGGALLLAFANRQGMIETETMKRGVGVLIGLGLAAMGNNMPKIWDGAPPPSLAIAAIQQAVRRLGGWAMMLSGIAFAGLWAFAPLAVAPIGSVVTVGSATVIVIGYVAWRCLAPHRSSTS